MLTDQGVIEGDAAATMRLRRQLCPDVRVLADVHVKHAAPLGSEPIEMAARDTLERGLADALIVSGSGTGHAADLRDLERVRRACPGARILVGSGVTAANVRDCLRVADGVIVGSSLKKSGRVANPVDARRVAALARAVRGG
jgi:membrane complex biogenesis BtpA family protein